MKDQVLSKEQMLELIDMGIDVSFASMYYSGGSSSNKKLLPKTGHGKLHPGSIPTFTFLDILEMLPNTIDWKGKTYRFSVFINCLGYRMIGYRDSELWPLEWQYFSINGAFYMLKWCKENNFIQ